LGFYLSLLVRDVRPRVGSHPNLAKRPFGWLGWVRVRGDLKECLVPTVPYPNPNHAMPDARAFFKIVWLG
jgi:hypothetical protein